MIEIKSSKPAEEPTNIIRVFINNEPQNKCLPDISYEKFADSSLFETGSSDTEYEKYLRDNNMIDLTDYNSQTTPDLRLVVEQRYRGRVLMFKCVYDSDNDPNFDEKIYFGKQT